MNATRQSIIAIAATFALGGAALAADDGPAQVYRPGHVGNWADNLGYRTSDRQLSPDYEHGRVEHRNGYAPGFESGWTAPLGLPVDGAAEAESADLAFQRMLRTFTGPKEARWVNRLVPEASGDYVAIEMSADDRLNDIVASYTRDTLDRGGWDNIYAPDSHYAAPNGLLAVDVGDGMTVSIG